MQPVERIIAKEDQITSNYKQIEEKILDINECKDKSSTPASKKRKYKILFDKIAFKKWKQN